MLINKTTRETSALDEAIDNLFVELQGFSADEEGYAKASDQLVKLMQLRKEIEPSWRVSPETLATIAANLLGILLILNFERAGVVASKALSFVGKLR